MMLEAINGMNPTCTNGFRPCDLHTEKSRENPRIIQQGDKNDYRENGES